MRDFFWSTGLITVVFVGIILLSHPETTQQEAALVISCVAWLTTLATIGVMLIVTTVIQEDRVNRVIGVACSIAAAAIAIRIAVAGLLIEPNLVIAEEFATDELTADIVIALACNYFATMTSMKYRWALTVLTAEAIVVRATIATL